MQQVAQYRRLSRMHGSAVFKIVLVIIMLRGQLQLVHHIGVIGMKFTTVYKLQQAPLIQRLLPIPGHRLQLLQILLQMRQTHALYMIWAAAKTQINDLGMQADDLKQLCTTITGNRGNTHLRHNLVQTLVDTAPVVNAQLPCRARQHTTPLHILQQLIGQVWMYSGGTVTDQYCKMMWITGTCGFHKQIGIAAQTMTNQPMMHSTNRQQGRDGSSMCRDAKISQHQYYSAALNLLHCLCGQRLNGFMQGLLLRVIVQFQSGMWQIRSGQQLPIPRLR